MAFISSRMTTIATLFSSVLLLSGCNLIPEQTRSPADEPLQNTYWKLISLNGSQVKVMAEQREPHLILKQGNKVQGYSGCNMFQGNVELKETVLDFQPLLMTRRACPGSYQIEPTLMGLLQNEVDWSIQGDQLKLQNTTSDTQATFKAVYLQ